jgi:outer membrane protein assembly factor BamB
MVRTSWIWGALAVACATASIAQGAALVSESQAARCGLVRAWFAQVGAPRSTGPVNHVRWSDGMLLVQTTGGSLAALDAETGRTLWTTQIGPRGRLTSEAAANKQFVAAVNGSTLYVIDRATGAIQWQRRMGGAPGTGTAVSETHAFVPMVDGRIEGYALAAGAKQTPWTYKSAGRMLTPPMITGQTVSWTTEQGYFYVADPAAKGVRYRLETRDAIHAAPGYWTPNLYAGSSDGFVYAVNEASGKISWKFSIGDAIYEPPVAIHDRVFAISQFDGMTCLDAKSAAQQWVAPGIRQFLAASPARVYVCDDVGRMVVLDIETGTRLAAMPLVDVALRLTNGRSDRIYLVGEGGAVQCLREVQSKTPVLHVPPPPPQEIKARLKERKDKPADEPPATDEPKTDDASPEPDALAAPAAPEAPAADEAKPEKPAEPESEDPFKTP